jgi:DNA ligase-1
MPTLTSTAAPTSPDKLAQNAEAPKKGMTPSSYDTERYIAEPKLDGWRLLIHVADDGVHLYTRTGKSHDGSLPMIEAEVGEHLPAGTWLDGEAVAMTVKDGTVTHEWGTVQSVLGSSTEKAAAQSDKITYMAFDLIAHGGIDARSLPYAKRRDLLERVFEKASMNRLQLVPQVEVTDNSLQALLAQGFEGMVIKDTAARYASGKRGAGWVKVKPQDNLDAVVMGFKPGENGFAGMVGAVIFGQHDANGKLVEVGRCSGMNMTTRKHMTDNAEAWLGAVIEIKHMGQMPTGGYRHPQFAKRRDDKPAGECRIDG